MPGRQGAGCGSCGQTSAAGIQWGEAITMRARMEAEGWRSVLVVSDPPHMLRLRYTWGSIFRGSNLTTP